MIIYLASPYTHESIEVRRERFEKVASVTARLMRQGIHVFSPIVHCHPLAERYNLPSDYTFWEEYDRKFLAVCGEMWIVMLDGWMESKGVAAEIKIARQLGIPVKMIGPYDNRPH